MKNKTAEVYIGLIIAIGIFLILAQTIVTLIFNVYDLVIFNRVRTTARFLAEEQLETVKNAAYDDVGTVGGIPVGIFEQNSSVVANGQSFDIFIRIDNVDDPFDGEGAGDSEPVDYKKAQVTVSWGGLGATTVSNVILTTVISPPGQDTVGGGIIDITVTDANGAPVSLAEVTLVASSLVPPVNTTLFTDLDGKIIILGAAACLECYEITATKTGFSTDRTYGTDEVTNPSKPDLTVIDTQVSSTNFSIDLLSILNISSTQSRLLNFAVFPSQQFILRGNKTIGTDALGTVIYKYAEVLQTDGSGNLVLEDLEWDSYEILIPTGAGWDVTGTNPMLPAILNPNENISISFSSEVGSDDRLLSLFKDSSLNPVASVAATLKENSTSLEATSSSGLVDDPDFGQVFFGNLNNATYTLYATASGFLEYTSEIIINDYVKENAILISE